MLYLGTCVLAAHVLCQVDNLAQLMRVIPHPVESSTLTAWMSSNKVRYVPGTTQDVLTTWKCACCLSIFHSSRLIRRRFRGGTACTVLRFCTTGRLRTERRMTPVFTATSALGVPVGTEYCTVYTTFLLPLMALIRSCSSSCAFPFVGTAGARMGIKLPSLRPSGFHLPLPASFPWTCGQK